MVSKPLTQDIIEDLLFIAAETQESSKTDENTDVQR